MGKESDFPRLYITVDRSKVARCRWCGVAECDEWHETSAGLFCSAECAGASSSKMSLWIFPMIILGIPLGTVFGFADAIPHYGILMILLIGIGFMIPMLLVVGFINLRGTKLAQKIPENSRLENNIDDITLLKAQLSHVECPNCDGNIDLTNIRSDHIYHCDYCGATGLLEILHTSK